jgi:hypothetical protein
MDKEAVGNWLAIQIRNRVIARLQFGVFNPLNLLVSTQASRSVSERAGAQLFAVWSQYVDVRLAIEDQSKEAYDDQASQ